MTVADDLRLEVLELRDWIDGYWYGSIPKEELRRRIDPLLEKLDPATDSPIVFYNDERELELRMGDR